MRRSPALSAAAMGSVALLAAAATASSSASRASVGRYPSLSSVTAMAALAVGGTDRRRRCSCRWTIGATSSTPPSLPLIGAPSTKPPRRRVPLSAETSALGSASSALCSTTAPASAADAPAWDGDDVFGGGGGGGGEGMMMKVNVHTIPKPELESLLASWGHPAYRATQLLKWVRDRGASDFDEMTDLPAKLRADLRERARIGSLEVAAELRSVDGTRKRAYRLWDGQLIESVLMPYEDGRKTACISSQAGCAMGCVFCATGQMGFARQLTPDEIFEQVARFASEVRSESGGSERLTNVVLMGMGEPMANYRNVMEAIRRMNNELGIGARRITVSTVGIVPNIRKLAREDVQVRLAVSLHCSSDEERSALLPANRRYGGIDELLSAVREYIDVTKRRVTFEWALIEGENDGTDVARQLGRLLRRHSIRRDMSHVNVIPLNPTGGFGGSPSGRRRVGAFVRVLEEEFGISATPRMRRGIDIDAGCGQLKAAVKKNEKGARRGVGTGADEIAAIEVRDELLSFAPQSSPLTLVTSPMIGVYEEEEYGDEDDEAVVAMPTTDLVDFTLHDKALDLDEHEGEVIHDDFDKNEADRLIALVQASFPDAPTLDDRSSAEVAAPETPETSTKKKTTTITDDDAVREARKRRKKLLKNLRMIDRLREIEASGRDLNEEQRAKVAKEGMWRAEVESLEHNLK